MAMEVSVRSDLITLPVHYGRVDLGVWMDREDMDRRIEREQPAVR